MENIMMVNFILGWVFFLCYCYQFVYLAVPFVVKPKPTVAVKRHKYALLICARNEEAVIGELLKTAFAQTYPRELFEVFVAADNCTDRTAEVARQAGAVVYERFNKAQVGKGYAMQFLLDRIREDYGPEAFDIFLVFDADNLLDKRYLAEMNKTFSAGYKVVTGYRNTKNYGDNWISAGYALWFLRESSFLNRPRMLLNTSCAVSGTGFGFRREVIEQAGGWNFFLLTEDIEFTVYNCVNGEKIGYCPTAELYDEQPVRFSQSWRQRMRWARGYMQVFGKYGRDLLRGLFRKNGFSCFDMCMSIMPAIIVTMISIVVNAASVILHLVQGQSPLVVLFSVLQACFNAYLLLFVIGVITTLSEWRHIHTTARKKILYMFTFPLFMFTYIPISAAALFKKVEWKQIEHTKGLTLQQVTEQLPS